MAIAKGTAYVSAKGTTRAATRVIAKDSATLGGSCGTPSSEEAVQKRCVVSLDNPQANWLRVIEVLGTSSVFEDTGDIRRVDEAALCLTSWGKGLVYGP